MVPMSVTNDALLPAGRYRRMLIELRWGDMDAYGHVNNVAVVRLMEEARVRLLGSPTASVDAERTPGIPVLDDSGDDALKVFVGASASGMLLVSHHAVDYRAQLPYRAGPIAVDMCVTKIGAANLVLGYVIAEPDGSAVYATAETGVVFVDRETGRPKRLSADTLATLEPILVRKRLVRRS